MHLFVSILNDERRDLLIFTRYYFGVQAEEHKLCTTHWQGDKWVKRLGGRLKGRAVRQRPNRN